MVFNGLIIVEGKLPEWFFKNIAMIGLRLKEYDWIEKFIFEYQHLLPENVRENAVSYNLAQLYFYQKKYAKVIEQLRNVEYEDIIYNFNSKTLLIATYFEMDEMDPLYSLLDTFRTFLNRRKDVPEQRRKLYINLIKFTKKLAGISPKNKKALQELRQEVLDTKNVASMNWLLERIDEMLGVGSPAVG